MIDLDDIDRAILRVVQKDASISMDSLSNVVNLSRNACWRRLKSLEDAGVIKQRVALVDPAHVGKGLHVMAMIRTSAHDAQWMASFDRAVRTMPEIVGAHRMSGDLDYVLRIRVKNVADYDRFYKELISRVSVSDISASFVMEDIKDTTEIPV
ncbi:MAG: Lrp/AsnC family transcriptional regulator [Pseudomonadota bacterium]